MGVFSKFKDLIGIDEEYEDDDYETVEEEYRPNYYERREAEKAKAAQLYEGGNVVPMKSQSVKAITAAFKLVVIEPTGFDECPKLVDSLKSRKPVIVNLEKLDSDTGRKIFDFLGGATYALNGNVQKVANSIFVFAPENVDISAEGENKPYFGSDGGEFNPWQ